MNDLLDPNSEKNIKGFIEELNRLRDLVNSELFKEGVDYDIGENGQKYYKRPAYSKLKKLFKIEFQIREEFFRIDKIKGIEIGLSYVVKIAGLIWSNDLDNYIEFEPEIGCGSSWENKAVRTGLNDITGRAYTRAKERVISWITGCIFLSNDHKSSKKDYTLDEKVKENKTSESGKKYFM